VERVEDSRVITTVVVVAAAKSFSKAGKRTSGKSESVEKEDDRDK
jgi:hypothetical protein